ncbi:MAG TPA: hypothetical protein VF649_09050 [Sphingomonas sp.]|uniref:hypothetical protein n=1 Tax=Sphingomonas sp. TaxID=28214 RepID=UPI002ED88DD3
MEHTPRSTILLLVLTALACWAFSRWHAPLPSSGWHLSLQVARVRISVGTAVLPVRNRTLLFEIGQVATRLVLPQ